MKTHLAVGVAVVAVALAAVAAAQSENRGISKTEIVLGMHTDLSGPAATYGVVAQKNVPVYLAMIFTRPEITFYAGTSPSSLRVKTLPAGTQDAVPLNGNIVLGRTPGDQLHTADMALFDLSIYGSVLNPTEIQNEFSLLAQAYGGGTQ